MCPGSLLTLFAHTLSARTALNVPCPAGQASLFTLSSSNAVVQMLGKSGPRVVSASIDSKRDLEQQLKSHCEHYIMALTKTAVEPMLGFITKVTAVRLAAGTNKDLAKPLRQQVSMEGLQQCTIRALCFGSLSGCALSCWPGASSAVRPFLGHQATGSRQAG